MDSMNACGAAIDSLENDFMQFNAKHAASNDFHGDNGSERVRGVLDVSYVLSMSLQ